MRIAFLGGHLSQRASGVRQAIEGLSGAIAANGLDIRVFGIRDDAWAEDAKNWQGAPADTFKRIGPANLGYMPDLASALCKFDPDLVHLHGIWMHSSAVAADWARRTDKPLITSPHGMLAPAALKFSKLRKRVMSLLYQNRCIARTSGFHATAAAEADDIRAYVGERDIRIIPNGVHDTKISLPDFGDRNHRVLAIGRLHPVKGYAELLRAWAMIEGDYPHWSLEIAGPDPDGYGEVLRILISQLDLKRASIGLPRFGEDRDRLISDSRVFALPSLTENFAFTVPEALICGTPVIASRGTPWSALTDAKCGWWVAPTPSAIRDGLRKAFSMPAQQLAMMGDAGRLWAMNTFGWDQIATDMIAFYQSVRGAN